MPIDESAYRRLEEDAGRQDGRLSVEDLGRVLPVDNLSAAEIAEVVERLERAGIDVDIDPVLTRRHPDASGISSGAALANPAVPATAAPGVPLVARSAAAMGAALPRDGRAGLRGVPVWTVNGVDMLPVLAVVIVALLLMVALG